MSQERKTVGQYSLILPPVYDTEAVRLYMAGKFKDASRTKTTELLYAIKEYRYLRVGDRLVRTEAESSQIIENLSHISVVVPVLETIEERYQVMQFKKTGMFLSRVMDHYLQKNEFMPCELVVEIINSILVSLDVLHHCYVGFDDKQGYLHMDVHPGNIFLENLDLNSGRDRQVGILTKFIDLQDAIVMDQDGVARQRSVALQTAGEYTAPERRNTRKLRFGEGCDLYSVAVILIQLLSLVDPGEAVAVQAVLAKIAKIGSKPNVRYRYQHASEMRAAVMKAGELLASIRERDYIRYAQTAYYMCIDEKTVFMDAAILSGTPDDAGFSTALEELRKRLLTNRPDQAQCLYIYRFLERLYQECERAGSGGDTIVNRKNHILLLYLGAGCYNNAGESVKAVHLADEFFRCREKHMVSFSDYLSMINRIAETYYDLGRVEQSLELQKENLAVLEQLMSVYRTISETDGLCLEGEEVEKSYGRALAAYGRFYYVKHAREEGEPDPEVVKEAVRYLERALDAFHDSDRIRTMSVILQIAAETKDEELFRRYAGPYFTGEPDMTPEDLYRSFLKDTKDYSKRAEDYVLLDRIRCLHTFCMHCFEGETQGQVVHRILEIVKQIVGRESVSFPVNLIFKHVGILFYRLNDDEYNDEVDFMFRQGETLNPLFDIRPEETPDIWTVYACQTAWIRNEMKKDEEANRKLYQWFLSAMADPEAGLASYKELAEKQGGLGNILRLT